MRQPEPLRRAEPLTWSPGLGSDVWEMFCACVAGDLAKVQRLIAGDPSLVLCQYLYRTPIYFAVRENRVDVAAFLLDAGADPLSHLVTDSLSEICRDRGYADMEAMLEERLRRLQGASAAGEPIAAAIRAHDRDEVRRLLDESPALLTTGDLRSNQPLHWAVMTRQIDLIDEVLSRGADINAKRFDGARPIQLTNGDYHYRGWRDVPADWPITPRQVLDHLRACGAEIGLSTACAIGDTAIIREILARDPIAATRLSDYVTYYAGSGSPLRNAAARGDLELVRLLLDHGADPNLPEPGVAPRGYALYAAAANRHLEVARLLLERGACPNQEVESSADALSRAIMNGDKPMIELLCSYGAARDLSLLACDGDVQTAAAMFAANPKLADDPDALSSAAGEGQEAFVRLMLKSIPDLPTRIEFPDWSVGAKTRELNELLFRHGMSASQPDWLEVTPLHHFARTGNVEGAALYLDHGADLEARDDELRSTPLGWAAKYGQAEVATLLLDRGANPKSPGGPAWSTPRAWATRRGHKELLALLASRGG